MIMKFFKNKFYKFISAENIIFMLITVFTIIFFIGGLHDANENSIMEGRRIAENSLIKAAASCYAFEGAYPAHYQYLIDNYGVVINDKMYIVHYDSVMPNIMPNIAVYVNNLE